MSFRSACPHQRLDTGSKKKTVNIRREQSIDIEGPTFYMNVKCNLNCIIDKYFSWRNYFFSFLILNLLQCIHEIIHKEFTKLHYVHYVFCLHLIRLYSHLYVLYKERVKKYGYYIVIRCSVNKVSIYRVFCFLNKLTNMTNDNHSI